MKIAFGCDHGGIANKDAVIYYLSTNGHQVKDFGTFTEESCDYPDYALKVCEKVVSKECDKGILICGTGIGMSIAANKMDGIIAAKVNTINEAKLCREHNMANVMTLSEYTENLFEIVDAFINTEPSKEERHIRRHDKIMNIK
jgi:ribose 5-phosphate isomerase B